MLVEKILVCPEMFVGGFGLKSCEMFLVGFELLIIHKEAGPYIYSSVP